MEHILTGTVRTSWAWQGKVLEQTGRECNYLFKFSSKDQIIWLKLSNSVSPFSPTSPSQKVSLKSAKSQARGGGAPLWSLCSDNLWWLRQQHFLHFAGWIGSKFLWGVSSKQLWAWGMCCDESSHTMTGVCMLWVRRAVATVCSSSLDWPTGDLDLGVRRGWCRLPEKLFGIKRWAGLDKVAECVRLGKRKAECQG